jgi:hypothetical protein
MSYRTDLREPSRATRAKYGAKRTAIIVVAVALILFVAFAPASLVGRSRLKGIAAVVVFGVGLWKTMPTPAEEDRYERWRGRR